MKFTELREMSDEQLTLTVQETEQGLFRLRMQAQKQILDAPSEVKRIRRLIAQIKTLQTQRASKAAAAQAGAKLGERGSVEVVGEKGRRVPFGERRAVMCRRLRLQRELGREGERRARAMLCADVAGRFDRLRRRAVLVLRMLAVVRVHRNRPILVA